MTDLPSFPSLIDGSAEQVRLYRESRKLAHRADPETAKTAAAEGALRKNTHRLLCLLAHSRYPTSGLTDDECSAEAGLELHEARRRCSDLRNLGLIAFVRFGDRHETRKTASGRSATVSSITAYGTEALGRVS